jgi:hypothetical protein
MDLCFTRTKPATELLWYSQSRGHSYHVDGNHVGPWSPRKRNLRSFLQDARRHSPFFLLSISPLQPIVASFSCSSTVRFHSTVHAPLILRLQSINLLLTNGRLEQSSRVFGVGFNRTSGPEISFLFRRRLMAIGLGLLESCHSGTSQRDSAESA